MKTVKYIVYLLCLALTSTAFIACDDDNDDGKYDNTPINVVQIFLQDTESSVQDRPVDYARLGQTIRIEGSGLLGMKKVYVNGYDTYFNQALMTDNNMWLQLKSKTPIMNADEDVRNTIRFVKSGAEKTIDFVIRAASPAVTHLSNSMPKAGELVYVYGTNLHETEKVTFPGGAELTEGITNDSEGEWYSFRMPEGITESGSIYSVGANGTAATPEYFNYTQGLILDFDEYNKQGAWLSGGAEYDPEGGFSMIFPEDLVEDPTNSGRGLCAQIIPERLLNAGGIGLEKTRATEVWTVGDGDKAWEDWSRFYSEIPAETPIDEVAFQFDILVPEGWTETGQLQFNLTNNFSFTGIGTDDDGQRTAFFVPYVVDGEMDSYKADTWTTVTIPFSEFGYYKRNPDDLDLTFQNVVDDRNAATYPNFGMGFVNKSFTLDGLEVVSAIATQKIYTDNWRVVPCAKITISDYPEDEEE